MNPDIPSRKDVPSCSEAGILGAVTGVVGSWQAVEAITFPSIRSAAESLASGRGPHFDPQVVDTFLGIPYRQWEEIALRNGVALRETWA